MTMTACVYIARDSSGQPLYVGSTGDLAKRLREHARKQPWWGEVADIEEVPAMNRAAAYDLERSWAEVIEALDGPERLLADALGVNYTTFSNIKRNVAYPSQKFIASAIAHLGRSFDELFYVAPASAADRATPVAVIETAS